MGAVRLPKILVLTIDDSVSVQFLHMGASGGPQSLPRVVTFNPVARQLEQAPIDEARQLRGAAAYSRQGLELAAGSTALHLGE